MTAADATTTPAERAQRAAYSATLRDRITSSAQTKLALAADEESMEALADIASALLTSLKAGGTVFFFGNGGSSTDAQHLSAELLGRFYLDRPALPSVCLSDNTAAMTAIANDYSYEEVFSRQLAGLGRAGDVAIGISTSGGSANVVRALQVANDKGLVTVAFTGARGGPITLVADHVLRAPSTDTPRIQECHLVAGHTLCEIVEVELWAAP